MIIGKQLYLNSIVNSVPLLFLTLHYISKANLLQQHFPEALIHRMLISFLTKRDYSVTCEWQKSSRAIILLWQQLVDLWTTAVTGARWLPGVL